MTPEQLKNSILQLAIQGKLVEQRKEEYVSTELFNAKKNIGIDILGFEIPNNWKLSTIEGISKVISTKMYQIRESEILKDGLYPVISQSKEPVIGYFNDKNKLLVIKKPVIIFGDHTTVVKYIDFDFVVGADGIKIFDPISDIDPKFFKYSIDFLSIGLEKKGGYSRHYKFIKNLSLPVPPLAEQKRIVKKIEELLPLVDKYEKAWKRLEELNKKFSLDMQKSILQEAIQGKLVEQRKEEGTGEELFKEIQKEKQKLIEEGTLKKQKSLSKITEGEIPFDIPETWKWVRLGEISTYSQAKRKVKVGNIISPIWSLDLEDIEKESGKIIRHIMSNERKISGEKIIFENGQILYSKLRPYLKKILIAPDRGICTPELVPFDIIGNFDSRFIVFVLKSSYVDFLINSTTYGVKMPRVGTETMTNLLIPLPSLAEQKRIVEKIEELSTACEKLKSLHMK